MNDQVSINTPAMMYGEVTGALHQMSQAISNQAQAITTQANREVVPRENQHASIMATRLRNFTRMNPPVFFGSKVDVKTPKTSFLYEVYKILFAMGMSTTE